MSNENTIRDYRINNIYYMLAYAFNSDTLQELKNRNVSTEKFENIYDIYSVLLSSLSDKLIKKGLVRQYVEKKEETNIVKGKINFSDTIKSNSLNYRKVICEYDDYTQNNYLNSIIKTTIYHLLNSSEVTDKDIKVLLKKTYFYFNDIDLLDYLSIRWDNINYNKNNENYRMIIELCRLINRGTLITEKEGKRKFFDFQDGQALHSLFEKFVREYLKKYYPKLNPRVVKMENPIQGEISSIIPAMFTDITVEYNNKIMIIDTKFYKNILNKKGFHGYDNSTLRTNNLYQIAMYVRTVKDKYPEKNISGMLLYAKTDESINSMLGNYGGINMYLQILDMTRPFGNPSDETIDTICGQLNTIATNFIYD